MFVHIDSGLRAKSTELLEHLEHMEVDVAGEQQRLERADVAVHLLVMLPTPHDTTKTIKLYFTSNYLFIPVISRQVSGVLRLPFLYIKF